MPKKKRPKLPPPRDVSIFDQLTTYTGGISAISERAKNTGYLGLYPPQVMDAICSEYKIEQPKHRERLWHCLEFQAVQFRDISQRSEAKATNAEIRTELADIKKPLETLISRLERLHPDTQRLFMKAQIDFQEADLKAIVDSNPASDLIGPEGRRIMQFGDVLPHLQLLRTLADQIESKLKRGKDGRPLNKPLYVWVKSLAAFWTQILQRPFTVNVHKNPGHDKAVGITESYDFLKDCLAPLAPSEVENLPSIMRYVRDGRSPVPKKG